MDNFVIGTIIKSIAGHDQQEVFIILRVEGEYVYLVNGKNRTLSKPKRKKIKHIVFVNTVNEKFIALLNNNQLLDSHIRTIIRNETKNIVENDHVRV